MEVKTDAGEILQMALADVKSGEDIDEAILRSCKRLYPSSSSDLFIAVCRMVEVIMEQTGSSKDDAVQQIASSTGTMSITVTSGDESEEVVSSESLDDFPPEIRDKLNRAMASENNIVKIERHVTRTSTKGKKRRKWFRSDRD